MRHYGNIKNIHGYDLPPVDIITGGSPCQDLSLAKTNRDGLGGDRSGLFLEQIRIIKEMRERDKRDGRADVDIRPRYMVWENVPGALSSNKGEDFRTVLEETVRIADPSADIPRYANGKWPNAGCIMGDWYSVAWRVTDSQFWGVAQRRRRIALIADFGGKSAPEILFECESVSGDSEPGEEEGQRTPVGITDGLGTSSQRVVMIEMTSTKNTIITSGISPTLTQRMGTGGNQVNAVLQQIS